MFKILLVFFVVSAFPKLMVANYWFAFSNPPIEVASRGSLGFFVEAGPSPVVPIIPAKNNRKVKLA